jgi:hypothetical protein
MAILKLKYTNLKKKKSTLLKFNINNPQIASADDWFIMGLSQHFLTKGLRTRNVTVIKKCLLDLKYELLETQFANRLYPPCGIEHKLSRHNVFWNRLRCAVRSNLLFTNNTKYVNPPNVKYNILLLKTTSEKFNIFALAQQHFLLYIYFFFYFLSLLQLFHIYCDNLFLLFFLKNNLLKFSNFFLHRIFFQYKNVCLNLLNKKIRGFLIYLFYVTLISDTKKFFLKPKKRKIQVFLLNTFFLRKKFIKFKLNLILLIFMDHYFLLFFNQLLIFSTYNKLWRISLNLGIRPKFIDYSHVKYKYTGINIDFERENIIVDKKNDYLSYILFLSVLNDLDDTYVSPNQLLQKKRGKDKEVLFSFDNIFQLFSYIKARNLNVIHKKRISLGRYISLGIPSFWVQLMQQARSNFVFLNKDFIKFLKKIYFLTFSNNIAYHNSDNKQLLKSSKFKHFWQQSLLKQRDEKNLFYSGYLFSTCSISYLLSYHLTYYMPLYIMPKHIFSHKNMIQRNNIPTYQTLDKRRKLVISWVLHLIKKNKNKTFDLKLKDELKKILLHETYLSVLNHDILQKIKHVRQFIDYRW